MSHRGGRDARRVRVPLLPRRLVPANARRRMRVAPYTQRAGRRRRLGPRYAVGGVAAVCARTRTRRTRAIQRRTGVVVGGQAESAAGGRFGDAIGTGGEEDVTVGEMQYPIPKNCFSAAIH